MSNAGRLILQLFEDEAGQDVIEYALLSSFIGVLGILAWRGVGVGIFNAYVGWDSGIQNISSCMPDPGVSGCGS